MAEIKRGPIARARKRIFRARLGAWLIICAAVGCDAVQQAQELIPNLPQPPSAPAVDSVGPGSIEVDLGAVSAGAAPQNTSATDLSLAGGAVKTAACQFKLIRLPGRPAILQAASAADVGHESFPSVFLRAALTESNLADLTAAPLPAQIFIQKIPDGPIWHSSRDVPVDLKIVEVGSNFVKAEFQGTLFNSHAPGSVQAAGRLLGRLSRAP